MAKAPIPGQVKTRLVPPLTAEQAADFYEAMLTDTVERFARGRTPFTLHAAVSPSAARCALRFPASWHVFPQADGDLGARLHAAVRRVMAGGAARVVAIGVDSPAVPERFLRRAFSALARADLVLGPTEDGGCYAIGLRRVSRALWAGIPWSTDRVCQALVSQARRLGFTVHRLPRWYDIDTMDDLERHRPALSRSRLAPRTRGWLRQHASVGAVSIV